MKRPVSALFVGDSTLLIRCADVFATAGHNVAGVVTKDRRVAAWARERRFATIDKSSGFEAAAAALDFEYLFSVANLDMLSQALVGAAKVLSLNFHDGPLPAYAGLNAPAWALLEGKTVHGVVWHEMTGAPDAGRIAASAEIEIAPFETALSLNTKCYEAGLATFQQLLRVIAHGPPSLRPQEGQRAYYSRTRRPPVAATLDFRWSADRVASTVRALQFGPYVNPLGFPKVLIGGRVLWVTSAEVLEHGAPSAQPGQVLDRLEDGIVIATSTQPVLLSGLRADTGSMNPLREFDVNATAAFPQPDIAERVDALTHEAAKAEPYWIENWPHPVALPYPRRAGSRTSDFHRFELGVQASADELVAAIAAWVSLVGDASSVGLLYGSEDHEARLGNAAPWFSSWRPLSVQTAREVSIGDLRKLAAHARSQIDGAGPLACDFRQRYGVGGLEFPLPAVAVFSGGRPPELPTAVDVVAHVSSGSTEVLLRRSTFDEVTASLVAEHVGSALKADESTPLGQVALDSPQRRVLCAARSTGPVRAVPDQRVFEAISAQAMRTPDRIAVQTRWESLTYAQLDHRIARVAAGLAGRGIGKGDVVGVALERGPDLIVALLAVMKAGAAYLPLDPSHPHARNELISEDARIRWLIAEEANSAIGSASCISIDDLAANEQLSLTLPHVSAADLAYLIYTSGSTGTPKGVMISHAALENFFIGMDERIPHRDGGVWLSVTSPTFDISALELFWTLWRGYTVALHVSVEQAKQRAPSFSLFYFAASERAGDAYRLLLEGAKFADAHGFEAVWTPERHFHEFGGPYPNPAITSAAVAAITRNVHVRAGSCVLPLHDPIRVAEDWALLDNISEGRVGVAFASGWNANDFALAPTAFKTRKSIMLSYVDDVRRLWRGDAVSRKDGAGAPTEIRTLPRPVQRDLPIWLTAARSPETFDLAGQLGCNVLTHLLGMSFEEVAENISRYRKAWREAGHAGEGRVTLMLHAFVGENDADVRAIVREPMKQYLRSAVDLVRTAAWTFPTIQQRALREGRTPAEVLDSEPLTGDELDAILDHAFERYYETSGLFGTPDRCVEIVHQAAEIDVDEIACLIDFGVDVETALAHLPLLQDVVERSAQVERVLHYSVPQDIAYFKATHLQCTPSMATIFVEEAKDAGGLPELQALLLGGEALSAPLAKSLRQIAPQARLMNMYGPTETTIWSTTSDIIEVGDFPPLGVPIANTTVRVTDPQGCERPTLVPGELLIGGRGLAIGYWERPDLTQERFVEFGERMYRTGDLARRHVDGELEFLGRLDHQVKIRGHRVELGEIEAQLLAAPGVSQAVALARAAPFGEIQLAAYFTAAEGAEVTEHTLRSRLAERLPAAMVPATFTRLAAMPLTPNGKIDRLALPAPTAIRAEASEPDLVGLEKAIAKIWAELLGRDRIGPTQNFFDLGGHSLLAVQLQRKLRSELPMQGVTITDIFRFPTVRSLAAFLGRGQDAAEPALTGALRGRARLAARRRSRE